MGAQGVVQATAFACQQRQRGALQQGGVIARQAVRGAPQHQPRQLVGVAHLGLAEEAHARVLRAATDLHADADFEARPHGQHVQARVLGRADEDQHAAFDVQVLAIGGVGAGFGAHAAVHGDAARRGGHGQVAAQLRVQPAAAQLEFFAKFDLQRDLHLARRARARRGFGRGGLGALLGLGIGFGMASAAHHHVGVQAWRVSAREVDQTLVDAEAARELQRLGRKRQFGAATGDDAAVEAAQQLELLSHEFELGGGVRAEAGLAGQPQLAATALEDKALDLGLAAAQRQRQLALAHVHALQDVAHAQAAALHLAFDLGRRKAPTERGAGAQRARQPPARRREGCPCAEVGHAPLEHALQGRVGAGPGGLWRHAQGLGASEHSQVGAGHGLREVPGAVFGIDAQAQVGQAQRLRAGRVGEREVAAMALQDHIGADAVTQAQAGARRQRQVAAPAAAGLETFQPGRHRQWVQRGVECSLRGRGGRRRAPTGLRPAQRRAEHFDAARLQAGVLHAPVGVNLHLGAQLARLQPR